MQDGLKPAHLFQHIFSSALFLQGSFLPLSPFAAGFSRMLRVPCTSGLPSQRTRGITAATPAARWVGMSKSSPWSSPVPALRRPAASREGLGLRAATGGIYYPSLQSLGCWLGPCSPRAMGWGCRGCWGEAPRAPGSPQGEQHHNQHCRGSPKLSLSPRHRASCNPGSDAQPEGTRGRRRDPGVLGFGGPPTLRHMVQR